MKRTDDEEDEELWKVDYDNKHNCDEQVSTEGEQECRKDSYYIDHNSDEQVSTEGEQECRKDSYYIDPELMPVFNDYPVEERMEALSKYLTAKRKDKKSSEAIDDDDDEEKTGEIGKKHALPEEVEVSVEGEQEHKKAIMAESSRNKGEDVDSGETKSSFELIITI